VTTPTQAEVLIEKLIPDGKALGRLEDGRVVIVEGAVPGDRLQLEEVSESKGLIQARAFRVLMPSPLRVSPRCPVVAQCGGCDWMVLGAEQQRLGKLAVLTEALLRTGKIDVRDQPPTLFSGRLRDGYRGRVRLQVAGERIGFYHRGSHQLVEPNHCAVSSPLLNAALGELRTMARACPGALGCFSWLELRHGSEGTVSVQLQRNETPLTEAGRSWLQALRGKFIVVTSTDEAESPEAWQRFQLTADTYMLSPAAAFTQVNWEVNQLLIERVVVGAVTRGIGTFLDAYAGSGNFALPLLARGLSGLAVESNRVAVLAAREAARRQGLPSAGFVAADACAFAAELRQKGQKFELVLVDPPRAGVKSGLADLASLATGWFGMCSCNPVTLARDLRLLLDLGFELDQVEAFDMFPQTHHIETLAWLRAPAALAAPVGATYKSSACAY
jgi:23S rRNA (uracil1939-C5)-methyltransferase